MIKKDLSAVKSATKDSILVTDAASFHLTEGIKTDLKPVNNPGSYAGRLYGIVDVAINKPFKVWLREEMILYELEEEAKGKTEWSVSDRSIMTTWIVACAFERLKNTERR